MFHTISVCSCPENVKEDESPNKLYIGAPVTTYKNLQTLTVDESSPLIAKKRYETEKNKNKK